MSGVGPPGAWELNPLGQPPPTMNYSYVLPFEKDFDFKPTARFFREYRWPLGGGLSLLYVLVVVYGGRLMRARGPDLKLRSLLITWNLGLALFSMLGCARALPELSHCLTEFGLDYSICNPSYVDQPVTSFWTAAFAWSKVLEFGDTFLLVLRKRPVIFLHAYHHVTVLLYCWHASSEHTAAGRWFAVVNFAIHSLMYSYYAARAAGIRGIPKIVPLMITSSQIAQMVLGFSLALRVRHLKLQGVECMQSWTNLWMCLAMYASYGVLFVNFFIKAYLSPKPKPVANGHTNGAANGHANGDAKKTQ